MTPHSEDQQLQLYKATPQASSSSLSSHVFNHSSIQDQGKYYHREVYQLLESQQRANNFASPGGSHNHSVLEGDRDLKFSPWKKEDGNGNQRGDQTGSDKWMPPKMRLMRKMMSSDQTVAEAPATAQLMMKFEDHKKPTSSPLENDNTSNNSSNNPIRVCADCNTTKTPLWRSGPKGPKSLCNACGIRQRKARRAMAAAAAAAAAAEGGGNGTVVDEVSSVLKTKKDMQHKDKRSNNGGGGRINNAKYKKRSKLSTPSHGKSNYKSNCFEDFLINLRKNLAFHQVFPQDEKEAAILLMALSCGLICG